MAELTQNSILRISDEKTLQLIELYHNEECLWNTNLDDYRNREKRARAADRIAKKLDIQNFQSRHVMIKFKNLRNSYCQELKKIANSVNSSYADDTTEAYRPKVFWFSKMDSFLRPHLQAPRGSAHSVLVHQEDNIKREDDETEEWVQMTNPEDVLNPDMNYAEPSCSDNDDPEMGSTKKRKTPRSHRNSKRVKMEEFERNAFSQTLRDISAQLHVLMSQNDDYFDNFGKYIASLLRSLPPQKALMLQPRIVELIASAGLGDHEEHISQSDERITGD